jgi:hypothetical protein
MTASLEERLRLLEDERAILQQLAAYAHSLDYGLEAEWLDVWTDDAEMIYSWEAANTMVDSGRTDFHHTGKGEIAEFFHRHTHSPDVYHKHFLVEPRITVDGDRASVTSYFSRIDRDADGPRMTSFGRYVDVFVRCPDGRWRIRERRGEIESRTPPHLHPRG